MLTHTDIPANYLYCFASQSTCPLAGTCLRAIAAQLLKDAPIDNQQVNALSPYFAEKRAGNKPCAFYRNNRPVTFAKGMTHLFDELPYAKAHTVRRAVMNCFSCETYFYQSRKGERLISPEELQKIQKVFQRDVPHLSPKFDDTIEQIDW